MKPCKSAGCPNLTRGHGWCTTCRASWMSTGYPTPAATVAVRRPDRGTTVPPVVLTHPGPAGARCGCCGRFFPLLVDDALCVRCDAALFPAVAS